MSVTIEVPEDSVLIMFTVPENDDGDSNPNTIETRLIVPEKVDKEVMDAESNDDVPVFYKVGAMAFFAMKDIDILSNIVRSGEMIFLKEQEERAAGFLENEATEDSEE